jgi:hypothetical protein
MLRKLILISFIVCSTFGSLFGQQNSKDSTEYKKFFIGSSAFVLANLAPNPPSFYQLNFGYRITEKDVISLEAITWTVDRPTGIPYGSSYTDKSEDYAGSIREYGIGIVYQRFLWKGLYSSLQILPLKQIYRDENKNKIKSGFKLFTTTRIGYHIPITKNGLFIEPSIAATFWPINANAPQAFAEKDAQWNKYFLFEPGLHIGFRF